MLEKFRPRVKARIRKNIQFEENKKEMLRLLKKILILKKEKEKNK